MDVKKATETKTHEFPIPAVGLVKACEKTLCFIRRLLHQQFSWLKHPCCSLDPENEFQG